MASTDIYTPTRNYGFGGAPQYHADLTTKDPKKMATQDRTLAYDFGGRIDQSLKDEQIYRAQLEDAYRRPMNDVYGAFGQSPGLTPDELAQLDPTEAERLGIMGDPSQYFNYFDPRTLTRNDNEMARMLRQNYGVTERDYTAALDPSRLRLSEGFGQDYLMSDAQRQDLVNRAGTGVRNQYNSAIGEMERGAAASGMSTPMALAAMRARYENQAAAGAADAMTEARIEADAERARRLMEFEQARLGAEQGLAGMRAGQAEYLGNLRGQTESNIGQTQGDTQRWIQQRGGDLSQAAEQTQAQRSADVYGIRAGNVGYGYDTKRADQQEYRNWLTGQTGQQTEAGANATSQRIGNYGTMLGAAGQATGTQAQYKIGEKNAPSWFSKNIAQPVSQLMNAGSNVSNSYVNYLNRNK